jgi:hypothetical protein
MTPLSPTDRARAAEAFATDVQRVLRHVVADANSDIYCTNVAATLEIVQDAGGLTSDADIDPVALKRVVSWVLAEMRWRESRGELTADERAIHESAWRLSDLLHGTRRLQ